MQALRRITVTRPTLQLPMALHSPILPVTEPIAVLEGYWLDDSYLSILAEDGRLFTVFSSITLPDERPVLYHITEPVVAVVHHPPTTGADTAVDSLDSVLVQTESGRVLLGGAYYHLLTAAGRTGSPVTDAIMAAVTTIPLQEVSVTGPVRRLFPGPRAFLYELEDGCLYGYGENDYGRLGLECDTGCALTGQRVELAAAAHGGVATITIDSSCTTVIMRDDTRYRAGCWISGGFMWGQRRFTIWSGA